MIVADIITFIKNRLRKRVLSHQFFLVLTILKTRGSFKNDQFLVKKKKKLKSLHKYRPSQMERLLVPSLYLTLK